MHKKISSTTLYLLCTLGWLLTGCLQPPLNARPNTNPANPPVDVPMPEASAQEDTESSRPLLQASTTLGDESIFVIDVVLDTASDAAANRLYVLDSRDQVHQLDASTLAILATLATVPGYLHLDVDSQLLYIEPRETYLASDAPPQIQVIDLATMALIGTVEGRYMAVDKSRNLLYTGSPIRPGQPEGEPLRRYDAKSLAFIGELPFSGVPVANPARDDLLVLAYSAYLVDPETGVVLTDLVPDIGGSENRWLTGSPAVSQIVVDEVQQTIRLDMGIFGAGAGAGDLPPPRLFDAATLEPIKDPLRRLSLLNPTIDGHIYQHSVFSRYVTFHNWTIYNEQGHLLTWNDGMGDGLLNPNTGQLYRRGSIVNLKMGSFDGLMPDVDLWLHDADRGRLYATVGATVLLFAERGGQPLPAAPAGPADLPADSLWKIVVSPTYADDQTVLVQIYGLDGGVFLSKDRGVEWVRLADALPREGMLTFAFSPAFASDQTIFAAGSAGEHLGYGVLRSTDGGLTWAYLWEGLTHLRTEALALSPGFAQDQTLVVQSRYYEVNRGESGHSVFESTDGGVHWSMVMSTTADAALPELGSLLPGGTSVPTLPLRQGDTVWLERTDDQGQSWSEVTSLTMENPFRAELLASPSYATDGTIYLASDADLWRSLDAGISWQQADWAASCVSLPTSDLGGPIRTWALSPELADGTHHLFLGTWSGEFIVIESTQLVWR